MSSFCSGMLLEFDMARQPPLDRARGLLDETVDVLRRNYNSLLGIMMCDLDGEDRAAHCVRTVILSLLVGLQLGLAPEQTRNLGLSAMFRDVGMALLPYIADCPQPLAEDGGEALRQHPVLALEIGRAHV